METKGGSENRKEQHEQFPQSIEGTRGSKDSAWQARQWFLGQRGIQEPTSTAPIESTEVETSKRIRNMMAQELVATPSDLQPSILPLGNVFNGGSLGETFDEAEKLLATSLSSAIEMGEAETARLAPVEGMDISISGVQTFSQAGTQTTFLIDTDALALIIYVSATQTLVNSGRKFDANFQIIEFGTNAVKLNQWWRNISFAWGSNFWISQGNNWGPTPNDYSTPRKWGLTNGLYIYRATAEVQGLSPYSFSNEQVFRIR